MLLKTRSLFFVTYNYFLRLASQKSYNWFEVCVHLKDDDICLIALLKHVHQNSLTLAGIYIFLLCMLPLVAVYSYHRKKITANQVGASVASLVAQMIKNSPAMQETWVQSLGQEDPLEEGMATHSSILAWRILWTEEPAGL